MLRVFMGLDVNTTHPANPYVLNLMEGLLDDGGVEILSHGPGLLSRQAFRWDILHIQWPEALWGWRAPGRPAFLATLEAIRSLKSRGTKVVATIHNYAPKSGFAAVDEAFYESIYALTDGFVHLGRSSEQDFRKRHGQSAWCAEAAHAVIHHMEYRNYDGRAKAGGDAAEGADASPKLLVFGLLREKAEEALAREAFLQAGVPDGRLVFAGRLDEAAFEKPYRKTLNAQKDPRIARMHRHIRDAEVDRLFRRADFVFIPRVGRLNSGVQSLAYSYDKIVIAPDVGVMGELVRAAGGLLYAHGDVASAAQAIARAAAMTEAERTELVDRIRRFRIEHMTHAVCARSHVAFYEAVLSGKAA